MIPKKTNYDQGQLFESRLSEMLDPHNNLRLLADLIEWGQKAKCFIYKHFTGVSGVKNS